MGKCQGVCYNFISVKSAASSKGRETWLPIQDRAHFTLSTAATGAQEKTTLYSKSANKIAHTHSHAHADDITCLQGYE